MSDLQSVINVTSKTTNSIFKAFDKIQGNTNTNKVSDSSTFDGIYNAAVNMIKGTNDYIQDAQKAEVAYATGELQSTHELAVIEQKANLALQYTVAVKNQLLSAYKEIMNIQI